MPVDIRSESSFSGFSVESLRSSLGAQVVRTGRYVRGAVARQQRMRGKFLAGTSARPSRSVFGIAIQNFCRYSGGTDRFFRAEGKANHTGSPSCERASLLANVGCVLVRRSSGHGGGCNAAV